MGCLKVDTFNLFRQAFGCCLCGVQWVNQSVLPADETSLLGLTMEPQATKTETNELEGAKTLRKAAGDCRVALADLIGFFTLKLLSLIRSFVVMKISSDTT